ncbi:SnoaL-like protein [Humitalea rosea]|uniref:SnoaL-like protein n=1 Tax=Humitalea rosea TaxID=990373 RepID=A0A2W7J6V1_9PROT|nr:nuclear transport factor 2 family protein [Humitalea rosea]PZW47016.1 SnoaL-like protein [Humitalea rosea]
MTPTLPPAIARYVAAKNRQDIDAMLACFAPDGRVHDEGREHVGPAAIRAWLEQTTRDYRPTVVPEGFADGVMTGLVSGDFPGSPVRLSYRFTLSDAGIARLEIG